MIRSKVLRRRKVISHHIYSSIWSNIKSEFESILPNSSWQIGSGSNVNFWLDSWCGEPLASQLSIPSQLHSQLTAKVSDFIVNTHCVSLSFPEVKHLHEQVTIPLEASENKLVWKNSNNGDLSFKYGIG